MLNFSPSELLKPTFRIRHISGEHAPRLCSMNCKLTSLVGAAAGAAAGHAYNKQLGPQAACYLPTPQGIFAVDGERWHISVLATSPRSGLRRGSIGLMTHRKCRSRATGHILRGCTIERCLSFQSSEIFTRLRSGKCENAISHSRVRKFETRTEGP